jgi:hypothetical protein
VGELVQPESAPSGELGSERNSRLIRCRRAGSRADAPAHASLASIRMAGAGVVVRREDHGRGRRLGAGHNGMIRMHGTRGRNLHQQGRTHRETAAHRGDGERNGAREGA